MNREFILRYRQLLTILGLACLAVLLPASNAAAARIAEVVVTNSSRELLLYFQVDEAITPDMEQGLQSGLPLTFTFFIELHRQRSGWLDQQIVSRQFNHRLSYDSLKNEYRVVREEEGEAVQAVASLIEARRLMTGVSGLALLSLAELIPDQDYTLRIRARLAEKSWPLSVHRLLPLRRLWSFETDWHSVDFRY